MSNMGLMKRISRRFSRPQPQQPPCPWASNSFPSAIQAWDHSGPAPRRLIELTMAATNAALNEINLDDIAVRPTVPDYFTIWPGEHYKLMAGFVKVLQPKVLIEIGTDTGLSSLAMKKYLPPDGKLVTFDLRPWREVPEHDLVEADFADGRLEQRIADLADPDVFEENRSLLQRAQLFFIDGPKNLTFETALMKHLRTIQFDQPPILIFDDTRLTSMLKFWYELPMPKLDLTGLGHWSGTGMIELRNT